MSESISWSSDCNTVTTTAGVTVIEIGCPSPPTSMALSGITQSSAVAFDCPQWNGSAWVATDIQSAINRIVLRSDFNALGDITSLQSGTGAVNTLTTAGYTFDGRAGFLTSSTGTTAIGVAGSGTALTDQIVLGTYPAQSCDIIRLPAISDATNRYIVDSGFTDNRAGGLSVPVDGAFFQYCDIINSGKWLCCCSNNNSQTFADSGIMVAINTWYRLEVKVSTTQAFFYIDGTLVATVGGIPTGTSRAVGKSCLIRKSVGLLSYPMITDYTHFIQDTSR